MANILSLKCLICGKQYRPDEVDYVCPDHGDEGVDVQVALGKEFLDGLYFLRLDIDQELVRRVRDGEIGDVVTMRCYRLHGPIGSFSSQRKPEGMSELLYQIARFHSFLWGSGGVYSDFYIHNIDELCWIKDAWPVKAHALGGRHYRGDSLDHRQELVGRRARGAVQRVAHRDDRRGHR